MRVEKKYLTMDKTGEKTSQETEPEDELLTVRPSEQEGWNDHLINVDAVHGNIAVSKTVIS